MAAVRDNWLQAFFILNGMVFIVRPIASEAIQGQGFHTVDFHPLISRL